MNQCDESPFQQISAYTLTIEPYLNTFSKQYDNIIVIDKMPIGPLGQLVSRFRAPRLSPFDYNDSLNNTDCCKFAIRRNFRRDNEFLTADDIPSLLAYLSTNGYSINSEITKIVQKTKYTQRKSFICVFYYTVV